jgi:hypothetical protein
MPKMACLWTGRFRKTDKPHCDGLALGLLLLASAFAIEFCLSYSSEEGTRKAWQINQLVDGVARVFCT